jgi:ABC-type antimicrobial peptide transport system permease subunit
MFYVTYMLAELRRRSGRTILTALGLAIGVGLVVTVNALSTGLDRAQAAVLEPPTGLGTDMSVSRPIDFSDSGPGGFPSLSNDEREKLREENGGGRLGLTDLGEPGSRFSRDAFVSTAQLSFAASEVARIRALDGVGAAAGGLTLNSIHIEGTVPDLSQGRGFVVPRSGAGGPSSIDATSISVAGVDERNEELGAITPGQVTAGRYFRSGDAREAILNESYASREGIELGETVELGIGGAFLVGALAPSLEATVAAAADTAGLGPRFAAGGPFGQGVLEPAATEVALDAPVSPELIVAAVGLALLGGLVAGAVGSLRAARLRPADALRHID